ncbi:MAG: hypothetical protein LBJ43_04755 [Propionibacteriaceae bacterium]|nr:hypothetical protein [Propionibacteriaceae bacterium]
MTSSTPKSANRAESSLPERNLSFANCAATPNHLYSAPAILSGNTLTGDTLPIGGHSLNQQPPGDVPPIGDWANLTDSLPPTQQLYVSAVTPTTTLNFGKLALLWTGIAMLVGSCAAIYHQFAHGVVSLWMVSAFAWPLLGAALPYAMLALRQHSLLTKHIIASQIPAAPQPHTQPIAANSAVRSYSWARVLHACAVTTFTLGAFMTGIFQIFGSPSDYTIYYWIAGAVLLLAAGITVLKFPLRNSNGAPS